MCEDCDHVKLDHTSRQTQVVSGSKMTTASLKLSGSVRHSQASRDVFKGEPRNANLTEQLAETHACSPRRKNKNTAMRLSPLSRLRGHRVAALD